MTILRTAKKKPANVCDSCLDAAYDDGVEGDMQDTVMRELGGDMADHLCDEIETEGGIICGCGCRRRLGS